MSNVIPLKKSTYLLSDDDFESVLQEVINHGRKFHDFACYPAVMRKVLGDALKRDKRDGESNVPA
ncbi:hypothetical protein [Pantoea agglomerans]|uniref:hypothetical protein n=1 Tax=Enterobacter agglomerans TaxID=549 RepID=UPI0021667694|nr:hypothetical protein [Pantoea agglomerans]UVV74298.1 hypothetical protein NYF24_08130 [Pantoea agglomerans]